MFLVIIYYRRQKTIKEEIMGNYNTIPNQTQALFNLATECCLRQENKKCHCPKQWASPQCYECDCFIGNYIDADMQQMKLFMREAHSRAFFIKEAGRTTLGARLGDIAIVLLIVFFIACMAAPLFLAGCTPEVKDRRTTDEKIRETLEKVAYDWDVAKHDIYPDGVMNCMDAAISFYKYYPDKKDVKIMYTIVNPPARHLFNKVKSIAVEPQAFTKPAWSVYTMKEIWGAKYTPSCNRDETNVWKGYAR